MRKIPTDKLALYGGAVLLTVLFSYFERKIHRVRKPKIWIHPLYLVCVFLTLTFLPGWIQHEIFSPGGVLVIGTILPIYNSIVAVCSVDGTDDKDWLQFWITWASLSFLTEFMDDITVKLPAAGEHWFEFEFFIVLWLIFPFTNGAALLYDTVTKPFIVPMAKRMQAKIEGWIQLLLALVNTSYIWMIWFVFLRLPEEERRFVVVALGTVYPIVASIVAVSQDDDPDPRAPTTGSVHITNWLTYWSTYMVLFVAMDYLENCLGRIMGFYSLCGAATIYLALPMFNGAEVVFRRVLVPLSGQYEQMLLRDAWMVRSQMVSSIPEKQRAGVLVKAAALFIGQDQSKKTS
jgi:hypothetical protein